MASPQVLAKFARHYKTGEPIPADLVTRMNRASAFGRGAWVCRQNDYTAISYNMYKAKPDGLNFDAITDDAARQYTYLTPLPATHMWASFGHLGGYSSAYYTYLWDKVIAEDFFVQFDHTNPREKSFNVAQSWCRSTDAILKEAAKCDIVCRNCHRDRTLRRRLPQAGVV